MKKNNTKKRILWSILFFVIAALTVWAVTEQNGGLSFSALLEDFSGPRGIWLAVAFLCVELYIWLEGRALLTVNRSLDVKGKWSQGILYSATDIYCSAITPSATGGQPASAYFMIKNGVPSTVAAVSLLVNLIMYTLAIVVIGIISLILRPDLISALPLPAQLLINTGIVIQILLAAVFILLLWKERLMWAIGDAILRFLGRIRLLRRPDRLRVRLRRAIDDYKKHTHHVAGQWPMLIRVFLYNLLQRIMPILISGLVCIAMGGNLSLCLTVCCLQSFVILGAGWIPIPGAMGITDYLLLTGLERWMDAESALHLGLCSRSISFYICVLLSGAYVLLYMIKEKVRDWKS